MKGFFATSTLLSSKAPAPLLPLCGACGLYKTCKSPKMPISGKGKKRILIIAEAPGAEEDERGIQLIGNSGQRLMEELRKYSIDMRKDCWLDNAVRCRPPNNELAKNDVRIDHCRPNITKAIKDLNPEIIIPLGGHACRSLLVPLWKEDVGTITRWAGWRIASQALNAWICPTFHPSYVLRAKDPVVDRTFGDHLREAVQLQGRPYDTVPDYNSQIERILDPEKAAKIIRKMLKVKGLAAFDYETNMLKPDSNAAKIVTCSICWNGERTIAYPWQGAAKEATVEFLRSDIGKIASNAKFEDRWSWKKCGVRVKNWIWCTMNNAHIYDNRDAITSIKFQSFIWLGMPNYDGHIKPLLQAKGNQKENQIVSEIDIYELLLYNGLDSLLEYLVAVKQIEAMGFVYHEPSKEMRMR